jgi:hypothetical protein
MCTFIDELIQIVVVEEFLNYPARHARAVDAACPGD